MNRASYARGLPLRRRALRGVQTLLGALRVGDGLMRAGRIGGATILMYHSVAGGRARTYIDPENHHDPALFERQVRFLAARRRVVGLSDLVDTLAAGQAPAPGTVVLTFDDGYRDNLDSAFPLLASLGLPATLFVASAYIAEGRTQWIDTLYNMFRTRTANALTVELGGRLQDFRLDGARRTATAYQRIAATMVSLDDPARRALLDRIGQQLEPRGSTPRLTMDWDDLRRVTRDFPTLEIGSHSVHHLDLSRQPPAVVHREMVESRAAIERVLERPVTLFSFPYNRVVEGAGDLLARTGYRAAVASGSSPMVVPDTPLACLPRIDAPGNTARLRLVTSSTPRVLSRWLAGRT